jgi:hypothetical protein
MDLVLLTSSTLFLWGMHDGDVNLSGVCCLLKSKVEIKGMGQSFPYGIFQGLVVIITLDLLVQPG